MFKTNFFNCSIIKLTVLIILTYLFYQNKSTVKQNRCLKNTNFIDHLSAKNWRRDSSKHLNFPQSRSLKLFTVVKKSV